MSDAGNAARHNGRMGLLKKMFGGESASAGRSASSQFHESESTARQDTSVNAPRRELIHVVLRDTMRKHGVPSDWLECRILTVVTRHRKVGMHLQFVVMPGGEGIVDHIHAFQETFWRGLGRFESRPRDWLFSLAWQFDTDVSRPAGEPAAQGWDDSKQPPEEQDTQPPEEDEEVLRTDLQALYAIRDAALSGPAELARQPQPPPGERGDP